MKRDTLTSIAGSGQKLIEVIEVWFFMFTADQILGFRLDRGIKPGYYSGGQRGSTYKNKILTQIKS